jgi:hypothetical protein
MAKTESDKPKMINLRELSPETASAIVEIQRSFAETTASKAVVRAIDRFMPLYRENQNNRQVIENKNTEIKQLKETHAAQLRKKEVEISELKDTIFHFFQAQNALEDHTKKLKKLIES